MDTIDKEQTKRVYAKRKDFIKSIFTNRFISLKEYFSGRGVNNISKGYPADDLFP